MISSKLITVKTSKSNFLQWKIIYHEKLHAINQKIHKNTFVSSNIMRQVVKTKYNQNIQFERRLKFHALMLLFHLLYLYFYCHFFIFKNFYFLECLSRNDYFHLIDSHYIIISCDCVAICICDLFVAFSFCVLSLLSLFLFFFDVVGCVLLLLFFFCWQSFFVHCCFCCCFCYCSFYGTCFWCCRKDWKVVDCVRLLRQIC